MKRTTTGFAALFSVLATSLVVLFAPPMASAAPNKIDCGQTRSSSWCSYVTQNIEDSKTIGYRDSISNGRRYAISGHCEASTQKTSSYSIGSTLGTEIKAGIFGGVKAEINSNIEKSMTSGYVTSATFKIPANSTVYCDRGIVNERLKGYTKLHACGGGCSTTTKNWTFQAPARLRWWIY
ncbi:hypothetical protein ACLM5J_07675 [Nocardioides sp. Bht2]|uniref:hypothetical protein n=1 Tax=Nocardioides sp. Bht2 TaxID=3392297 RepID=UPI0039B3F0E9